MSVTVGIILVEAGLGLKLSKLTGTAARVYRRLVSIGIVGTWAVGTVAAYLPFDVSLYVAARARRGACRQRPDGVVGTAPEFLRP